MARGLDMGVGPVTGEGRELEEVMEVVEVEEVAVDPGTGPEVVAEPDMVQATGLDMEPEEVTAGGMVVAEAAGEAVGMDPVVDVAVDPGMVQDMVVVRDMEAVAAWEEGMGWAEEVVEAAVRVTGPDR